MPFLPLHCNCDRNLDLTKIFQKKFRKDGVVSIQSFNEAMLGVSLAEALYRICTLVV